MFNLESRLEILASKGYVVLESVLPDAVISQLLQDARLSYQEGHFRPGRVGRGAKKARHLSVRGDQIHWIADWSNPPLDKVESLFEAIQDQLRSFLFLPIKRFESHFAFYPQGTHYQRHKDRHKWNPSRLISCVIYLSPWPDQGGGELVLYPSQKDPVLIEPRAGSMILFLSELEHEVRPTQAERWSLTAWFRDDLLAEFHLS